MKRLILLLPVIAGILFGAAGLFVRRFSSFGFNNITIIFSRTVFSVICMTVFMLIYDRKLFRIKLRDVPLFLGTGITGMLGLNICYNGAVGRLTMSLAAVLLSTAPVFVMFLASVLFKEKITGRKLVGIALTLAGCILSSGLLERSGGGEISFDGILLGLGSAVFYALYNVISKAAGRKGYSTYTIIFYSVLIVSLVTAPFVNYAVMGDFIAEAPAVNILFLLANSLCISVLPYIFLTISLQIGEAGKVSILASGGEPAAALAFGLLFYREVPTVLNIIGLIILIAALVLICMEPAGEKPSI